MIKMCILLKFDPGVAGYGCGQAYSLMKRHPDALRPILQCSAVAGESLLSSREESSAVPFKTRNYWCCFGSGNC